MERAAVHQQTRVANPLPGYLRWVTYLPDTPDWELEPPQRERQRKSRLYAWMLPALVAADLLSSPLGLSDPLTLSIVIAFAVIFVALLPLTRAGHVAAAGVIVVGVIDVGVLGSIATYFPGGLLSVTALPSYLYLAIPVMVAACLLPSWWAVVVAALNCTLIVGDFFLQPHANDLTSALNDTKIYQTTGVGTLDQLVRPTAILLLVSVFAVLMVRSFHIQESRASREELLRHVHEQAREVERQRRIDIEAASRDLKEALDQLEQHPDTPPRLSPHGALDATWVAFERIFQQVAGLVSTHRQTEQSQREELESQREELAQLRRRDAGVNALGDQLKRFKAHRDARAATGADEHSAPVAGEWQFGDPKVDAIAADIVDLFA